MRTITRNAILVILAVLVGLLALGALPSLLSTGDPYYLVATTVDDGNETEVTPVDIGELSERQFPYATGAIETGRSEAYYEGPAGFKEAFSHSPFDELDALDQRDRDAAGRDGGAVTNTTAIVQRNGTVYRLDLVRGDGTANGT
jgi:hypothetical protein